MGLFAEASVAIDGSKFKAVHNRDKNFTQAKMERRLEQKRTALRAICIRWTVPIGKSRQRRARPISISLWPLQAGVKESHAASRAA